MIVDWPDIPPSLNKVLRMHWGVKRKQAEKWAAVLCTVPIAERRSLLDAAKAGKRVGMTITLYNARRYDKDNAYGACKVIVDAAKTVHLIRDDREEYLRLEVRQEPSTRKAKRTIIELEVIERRRASDDKSGDAR